MDALIEELETKLTRWPSEIADRVRQHLAEIIEFADNDALDIARSRQVEPEVLDLLDEP